MQKLTSDDVAGEIYKILRNKNGWLVQTSCSGENAHLQITADDGSSFIVYISPLSPLPSDEEDRRRRLMEQNQKKNFQRTKVKERCPQTGQRFFIFVSYIGKSASFAL